MYQHAKVLNICARLKHSWCLKSHVEIPNEQQELIRISIIKQGHFKFIEVRISDVGSLRNLIKNIYPICHCSYYLSVELGATPRALIMYLH